MIRNLMLGTLMPRNFKFLGSFILALFFCLPAHSQDSPSLGDLARKVQKEKGNKPAAKTLTNDDLPSTSRVATPPLGAASNSTAPGKPTTTAPANPPNPADELAGIESMLNKVDSLDRATLAQAVLMGADSDFPGRIRWEQKMYAAKQAYVLHGRELIQKAKQLASSAEGIKGPDDPRAKDLTDRLKEFMRDAAREDAAFQAVILEGRDLAGRASTR